MAHSPPQTVTGNHVKAQVSEIEHSNKFVISEKFNWIQNVVVNRYYRERRAYFRKTELKKWKLKQVEFEWWFGVLKKIIRKFSAI